jgi:hypothetical protein
MDDVELMESLVDSLDTGLPDRPDLAPVRAAGTRQRRRRRLGWTAGACAAAGALVVPALLLAGPGGTAPTVAPDVAADPGHSVAPAPPPVPAGELAGPEFGTGLRTAVEQAFPGATFRSEQLADGWRFSDHYDAWDWTVGNPVGWDTLFAWSQLFGLPDGVHLTVGTSRTSPDGTMGAPGAIQCNQPSYPSRRSCQVTDGGAQQVMVNDGIQYDDPTRWYRDVDVSYVDETRGMPAHVTVSAWTDAPTWEQARNALPSIGDLTALGLQGALVLPAPDHYPYPADLADHMTSTP